MSCGAKTNSAALSLTIVQKELCLTISFRWLLAHSIQQIFLLPNSFQTAPPDMLNGRFYKYLRLWPQPNLRHFETCLTNTKAQTFLRVLRFRYQPKNFLEASDKHIWSGSLTKLRRICSMEWPKGHLKLTVRHNFCTKVKAFLASQLIKVR